MATTPPRPLSTFDLIISNGDDKVEPASRGGNEVAAPRTTPVEAPAARTTTPAPTEQFVALITGLSDLSKVVNGLAADMADLKDAYVGLSRQVSSVCAFRDRVAPACAFRDRGV